MTRSPGIARIILPNARWLLPWVAVLFVAVTLAYAMTTAVHEVALASSHQLHSRVATQVIGYEESGVQGATFGVLSTTTPASTGHASSDGCCTWN
jgi:hypothetical protein